MMSYEALYMSVGMVVLVMVVARVVERVRRRGGSLRERHFAFSGRCLEHLEAKVPVYGRLPMDLRTRLQDRVIQFMDGKRWKHCGGLEEVTEEMKVAIAGQACVLTLGRGATEDYVKVLQVLLYPWDGVAGGLPAEEAWPSASVVLAWEAGGGARDVRDEGNGVLGAVAERWGLAGRGGKAWGEGCGHSAWARVMSGRLSAEELGRLGAAVGVEGRAGEVFAAATEVFFELPEVFLRRCPEGYEQLRLFYKLDPARWLKA